MEFKCAQLFFTFHRFTLRELALYLRRTSFGKLLRSRVCGLQRQLRVASRLCCSAGGNPAAHRPNMSIDAIPPESKEIEDLYALHKAACDAHKESYTDPKTGYHVFTEFGLRKRGRCCGSGCRHCPYAHECVPKSRLLQRMNQPAFLHITEGVKSAKRVWVLFFSGGKDSFLALRALIRDKGMVTDDSNSSKSSGIVCSPEFLFCWFLLSQNLNGHV